MGTLQRVEQEAVSSQSLVKAIESIQRTQTELFRQWPINYTAPCFGQFKASKCVMTVFCNVCEHASNLKRNHEQFSSVSTTSKTLCAKPQTRCASICVNTSVLATTDGGSHMLFSVVFHGTLGLSNTIVTEMLRDLSIERSIQITMSRTKFGV